MKQNHVMMVDRKEMKVAGLLEMKKFNHISMLFVASKNQRQDIGCSLLNKAIELCKKKNIGVNELTVHSSPNAVLAYEKLGFERLGEEVVKNGIKYIPMKLSI